MPKRVKELPGAPTKLTQEVITQISNGIKAGAYVETVVASLGIEKATFYKWLKLGNKQSHGLCKALVNAVHKAFADSELRDLLAIEKAAHGSKTEYVRDKDGNLVTDSNGKIFIEKLGAKPDWKASAWRLERKFPKRWGMHHKVELTGAEGGPIKTEDVQLTKEQIREKLQEIIAEAGLTESES